LTTISGYDKKSPALIETNNKEIMEVIGVEYYNLVGIAVAGWALAVIAGFLAWIINSHKNCYIKRLSKQEQLFEQVTSIHHWLQKSGEWPANWIVQINRQTQLLVNTNKTEKELPVWIELGEILDKESIFLIFHSDDLPNTKTEIKFAPEKIDAAIHQIIDELIKHFV
jgi:hypothetical protein